MTNPNPRRSRARSIVVAAACTTALVLSTAACGSDDNAKDKTVTTAAATQPISKTDQGTSSSSSDTGGSSARTLGLAEAPVDNQVTITAPGMSFEVSGDLRPGPASITYVNTSPEAHMLGISKMKDGVTLDQIKTALAKSEDAATALLDNPDAAFGTPAAIGAGWATTTTTKRLEAGNYALVCFFTDAAGQPHVSLGMIGELKVTGEPVTTAPEPEATIEITDDGITLPEGFTGRDTYLVSNTGSKPHGFQLTKLDAGTTLEAYNQHVGKAQMSGGAVDGGGGTLAGGVDTVDPGQGAWLTLDLPTGHYGFVSIPDETGPELPAQHGEFDVA